MLKKLVLWKQEVMKLVEDKPRTTAELVENFNGKIDYKGIMRIGKELENEGNIWIVPYKAKAYRFLRQDRTILIDHIEDMVAYDFKQNIHRYRGQSLQTINDKRNIATWIVNNKLTFNGKINPNKVKSLNASKWRREAIKNLYPDIPLKNIKEAEKVYG